MKILRQTNPVWKNLSLGGSKLTIGGFGCTSTALAEANNKFGAQCTPVDVSNHKEFYTSEGLILWTKLDLKYVKFEANGREYKYNEQRIFDSLTNPKKCVLLQVMFPKAGQHWVFGEALGDENIIYARDPFYGDICDVKRRYGAIIGSAHFERK